MSRLAVDMFVFCAELFADLATWAIQMLAAWGVA